MSAAAGLRERARRAGDWCRARPIRTAFAVLAVVVVGVLGLRRDTVRAIVRDELGVRRVEAFADLIEAAAREAAVDPHLVAAIVFMESRGQVGAVSSAGALGLMQLMPAAASDAAKRLGLAEPSAEQLLSDPALNLRLGCQHLAWLLEHRGAWSLEQVLVAYHAGRVKLMRWMEEAGGWRAWRSRQLRSERRGEPHAGSLAYAQRALAMCAEFRERGVVENPQGIVTP